MRDKWQEYKYYSFKRNGKNCYIRFRLEKHGDTIFKSAIHKVSLNIFRILKTKNHLSYHGLYI